MPAGTEPAAALQASAQTAGNTDAAKTDTANQAPRTIRIKNRTPKQTEAAAPNPFTAWLLRGNLLLKTGALVLFLGLAFLLRHISDGMPLPLRYAGVFGLGLAAVGGGLFLRAHRREYGLTVQGLGMAVMYLTVLAAVKLHPLLPPAAALAVMTVLVAATVWLALRQDARIMAQAAVAGGIAAPVLVSDGSGSHIALFAYLALLNSGVAAIAWFKAWRSLNLIGMGGTLAVAAMWGAAEYTPQHFASSEPFLLYHWLLYTLVACFFARHALSQPPHDTSDPLPDNASLREIAAQFAEGGRRIGALDGTLLFGSALASFGLQYQMLHHFPDAAAAYFALLWAAVYAGCAFWFARGHRALAVMTQAFALLALLFFVLAVPLAWEGTWTASAWTLQALLVYWFGLRERQPATRLAALAVYLAAACVQLASLSWDMGGMDMGYLNGAPPDAHSGILRGSTVGTLLTIAGGGLMFAAWRRYRSDHSAVWENRAAAAALGFALLHTLMLPALWWEGRACMAAYAALALIFALAQRRVPHVLFAAASAAAALLAWVLASDQNDLPWVYAAAPLLPLAAAYLLHTFRLPESRRLLRSKNHFTDHLQNFCGWVALWFGVFQAALVWDDVLTPLLSHRQFVHWLAIALILLAAARKEWRQGVIAAAAVLSGVALWRVADALDAPSVYWVKAQTPLELFSAVAATALAAWALFRLPERKSGKKTAAAFHIALPLLFAAMWTLSAAHFADVRLPALAPLFKLAVPLVCWFALAGREHALPFSGLYRHLHAPAAALFAVLWLVWANLAAPPPQPLPYLPVLNAVEIGSLAVLWQLVRWLRLWLPQQNFLPANHTRAALPAFLLLVLLSGGVMRVWHHYFDIPWRADALLASFGVQAALSVVWSLTAILAMVSGSRSGIRLRWLAGAALMAVVVVKLFLVELGDSGGVARIVSFIAVGLLLLLVGWFAPVPPKREQD